MTFHDHRSFSGRYTLERLDVQGWSSNTLLTLDIKGAYHPMASFVSFKGSDTLQLQEYAADGYDFAFVRVH